MDKVMRRWIVLDRLNLMCPDFILQALWGLGFPDFTANTIVPEIRSALLAFGQDDLTVSHYGIIHPCLYLHDGQVLIGA